MSNQNEASQEKVKLTTELERLIKFSSDLERLLREQRKFLTERGMTMPLGALMGVQEMNADLTKLIKVAHDTETQLQRMEQLQRTAELVNSTLDLEVVLNDVMDTVILLTGAERGYLMLLNPDTGQLEPHTARNMEANNESTYIVSSSIAADVVKKGIPVLTTNASEDTRYNDRQSVLSYALRSILCVPMIRKERVIGVIYADNRMLKALFGEKELHLLQSFASQAAIAIENAQQFGRVKNDLVKAQREVQELRIQIDQKQIDKQLKEITESDFFQYLQTEAMKLRQEMEEANDT